VIEMNDAGWGASLTADVLEDRYGLVVDVVEPAPTDTDTITRPSTADCPPTPSPAT
jgi:homoserine kinase type II